MTHTFRVWAPKPKQVILQLGAEHFPLAPAGGGWWQATLSSVRAPGDYGFILDGEGPFPDPRSPFQPAGINGLSRLVDHAAFSWTDANWRPPTLASAVIYELHTGTFTPAGTFDAAIPRLQHPRDGVVQQFVGIRHDQLFPAASGTLEPLAQLDQGKIRTEQ